MEFLISMRNHICLQIHILCSWALKGLPYRDFGAYVCTILVVGPFGWVSGFGACPVFQCSYIFASSVLGTPINKE